MITAVKHTENHIELGWTKAELLRAITPKKSPAYSANLHRWMRRHGRVGDTVYRLEPGGKMAGVYCAGTLFIGQPYADYSGDTDFSGVLLMAVLCNGSSAKRACYAGAAPSMAEVDSFWGQYKRVGRCAIDPNHTVGFTDHAQRFHLVDGQPKCIWCAAVVANSSGNNM